MKTCHFRCLLLTPFLTIVLLVSGCGNFVRIQGASMEPAISDGERVAVDPNAFNDSGPRRGDIIVATRGDFKWIRRVIGLPGERITIEKGAVYVNGNRLEEPYLAPGTQTESATKEFLVPAGSYFVLGDNRAHSSDSRNWLSNAFLSKEQIAAKVLR